MVCVVDWLQKDEHEHDDDDNDNHHDERTRYLIGIAQHAVFVPVNSVPCWHCTTFFFVAHHIIFANMKFETGIGK
jgi:hypothetical protein